jgi:formylglycine-generating enzyme required for sulfatase activity
VSRHGICSWVLAVWLSFFIRTRKVALVKKPIVSFTRLSRVVLSVGMAALLGLLAVPAHAQVTIDMVTVGNPGNANDTGGTGNGAVSYSYQIGKYDVTIGQYTAFLNAADPSGTNPNGIYNASMATDLNIAGISYTSGASTGSKYAVISNGGNSSNRPITYVSWFDAARFANWMTNGQGGPGTTETGAYDLATAAPGVAPAKTPGAAFRLPTNDEWYKAAYYSPNYGGVGVAGYYAYATQSNTDPGNQIGGTANQANYNNGLYSVTQEASYSASQNYLTDVGAFSGSGSFYGTFDQSGNVYQWNDLNGLPGSSRGLRGGYWDNPNSPIILSSSGSFSYDPSDGYSNVGFRLASPVVVPEPSTWVMAAGGLACAGWGAWRRRRAR